MGLTRNLRRTGRAAAIERADEWSAMFEREARAIDRKEASRLHSIEAAKVRVRMLKELDAGWERWYDENVPEWTGMEDVAPALIVLDRRIEELLKRKEATATQTRTRTKAQTSRPIK